MAKKIKGSFLFKITGSDGKVHEWLVDLKSPPGTVTRGTGLYTSRHTCCILYSHKPMHVCVYYCFEGLKGNCTLSMKDSDFMDLVGGNLGPQKARQSVQVYTSLSFDCFYCTQAFFEGKLKVSGNTALALKLQTVMPKPGQAKL